MRALALGTLGPLALLAFAATAQAAAVEPNGSFTVSIAGPIIGQYGKYNPGDDGADTDGR